jgi:protease-4
VFRWLGRLAVACSFAFNFLILLVVILVVKLALSAANLGDEASLQERYHSGSRLALDKVAIVDIDGVILEGMTGFARRQIDMAAADDSVKAVVVRINSPGGSITASDDLYQRLRTLRDGNPVKKTAAKPLVVSMGSLAASGGYYVAMPAREVFAERTTMTGSIGVYASFPNIAELAEKYGVKMNTIKAGAVKDSGSIFHPMTTQERHLWQDMVDTAYHQFLDIVRDGRGHRLKYPLEAEIKEEVCTIPERDQEGAPVKGSNGQAKTVRYVRQLADGGIFTADKALKYGLIDQIGYLDDAVARARQLASLGDDCKVITYHRPPSLLALVMGESSVEETGQVSLRRLASGVAPRLWYLAPEGGLAGILAASAPADR